MAAEDVEMILADFAPAPKLEAAVEDDGTEEIGADAGLEMAAEELMAAVEAKDAKGVVATVRSMFEMMLAERELAAGDE